MGSLRSSRPRLRAALVAMLATLAASAITAPGAAHAAESDLLEVKLSAGCPSFVVVMFTKLPCSGTVRNISPTDGAPTGRLEMFNEGFGAGSFPTGRSRCNLQPVPGDPRASTCRITYEVRRLNPQGVAIAYLGDEAFEPAIVEDIPLRGSLGLPTATGLVCQVISLGETGKCMATVGGLGTTTVAPTGIVSFSSIPIGAPVEFSSLSCQLQPLTLTASRCEIDYRPAKAGGWVFRASYEGNFISHSPSRGETTVAVQPPVNAPALEVGK
jgi:hypothetical protein